MKCFAWNLFYYFTGNYYACASKGVCRRAGIQLHLSSATCWGSPSCLVGVGRKKGVSKTQREEVLRAFPNSAFPSFAFSIRN